MIVADNHHGDDSTVPGIINYNLQDKSNDMNKNKK